MSAAALQIAPDVLIEAGCLVAEAQRCGIALRLLGGGAIQLRGRGRLPAALVREPNDIDLLAARGVQSDVAALLTRRGYRPDEAFNRLEGSRRLLFYDEHHRRQVDVFVGAFEMCHALPLCDRLEVDDVTLPPAELALSKLQIVELNEKDRTDLYALLAVHDVAGQDGPYVNAQRIAALCAGDWGLWRTCTMNLARLRAGLDRPGLDDALVAIIEARVAALAQAIETAPKSRRWRMRARIGDRVRWYETPDEVGQD